MCYGQTLLCLRLCCSLCARRHSLRFHIYRNPFYSRFPIATASYSFVLFLPSSSVYFCCFKFSFLLYRYFTNGIPQLLLLRARHFFLHLSASSYQRTPNFWAPSYLPIDQSSLHVLLRGSSRYRCVHGHPNTSLGQCPL